VLFALEQREGLLPERGFQLDGCRETPSRPRPVRNSDAAHEWLRPEKELVGRTDLASRGLSRDDVVEHATAVGDECKRTRRSNSLGITGASPA